MTTSFAQNYSENRPGVSRGRETGLRLGGSRLHGALDVASSYDSNSLYSDQNPQSDYVLVVIPGVDWEFSRTKFNLLTGYRFTYRNNFEQDVQDDLAQQANLVASYALSRRLDMKVTEKYEDTSEPADVEIPERLGRITNNAGAEVRYHTPGDDLDLALKYANMYEKYEALLSALSFYDNKVSITSRVNISSHFRFLPKSVASATMEYGQTNFNDDQVAPVANNDSRGISFSAGLNRQFTRKIGISANAGFATLQFEGGPDATSATGSIDARFTPRSALSVTTGYKYDVQVSTFTNYFQDHHVHLDGNYRFARRWETHVRTSYDFLDYSPQNLNADGSTRADSVIQGLAGLTFELFAWMHLKTEYQLDYRDSNAVDPLTGSNSASFLKHRVNVGISVYY